MQTIRLVYSSESVGGLAYGDFLTIMDRAARTNTAQSITGILCYGSGHFLQALEGDRSVVNALYHRIALDPRHDACELLSVEDITTRDFAEWSMRIVNWDDAGSAGQRAALLKNSGSSEFDPRQMSGAQATTFLRDLANMQRMLAE